MTAQMDQASSATADSTLACPKCGHPNPAGEECCQHCHKHLYVHCRTCGFFNFRGNVRCEQCRTLLRDSLLVEPPVHLFLWPIRWRCESPRKWLVPVQFLLLIAFVALAFVGIVKLAEYDLPNREGVDPQPEPKEVYILKDGRR